MREEPRYIGGFPGRSDGKKSTGNARDPGSIPGLGRSPGEGNGYPLLYSCVENPSDRGAWWAVVHRVIKSQTWLKWLCTHARLMKSLHLTSTLQEIQMIKLNDIMRNRTNLEGGTLYWLSLFNVNIVLKQRGAILLD